MSRPLTPTPIRPISSKTIECDPVGFAQWLNDLADLLNYTNRITIKNYNDIRDLERRVECLEYKVEDLEIRVTALEKCCKFLRDHLPFNMDTPPPNWTFAGGDLSVIHQDISNDGDIYKIVNLVDNKANYNRSRINWWDNRLPRPQASMPADFKVAFGNINVMSANGGTPSLNVGIFTSNAIENNDLYFN